MKTQKSQELTERHRKHLWGSHILYHKEPIALDHGEGCYVYDVDDNKYLDFFGGILTTSVGHNHPKLVKKVSAQLEKIIHTSTLYPHANIIDYAEKLAAITPGKLESSYFTNSGSEANELAVLAARVYTGNFDIIALRHGYSGGTSVAKALTAQAPWRSEPSVVPGIKYTLNGYCYRCPFNLKPDTCGTACAQDMENVIRTTTSGKIAGVLFEPIQGVGGFITPPKDFLQIISDIARHYGGVVIGDEVQGGFGRTGKHWFSVEHWGVTPDIMTMAKGIANGLPLGNVITTDKIAESTKDAGLLINTFGGNPVSAMAALATLEILYEEADPQQTEKTGNMLMTGLQKMQEKYPVIGEVRGKGLMIGIELVKNRRTKEPDPESVNNLFEETKKQGLLIGKGGLYGNVLRIAPPLTVTEDQIEECLAKTDKAFAAIHKAAA